MTDQKPVATWPARFMANQVSIHESDLHQIWISSIEVRKVIPRLRADAVLLKEYPADFMKLDRGPRHFFNERALTKELMRVRSQEALMFLAWLEKVGEKPSQHIAAWFAATGAGRTNETGQMARRVLK